jgi:CTP:phosphocholine cytidylyltransferase-like protein
MKQTPNIKAIILAAGVCSRIKPMTDNCPKNLLKINGVPILAG